MNEPVRVAVVGSINTDLICPCPHLPGPGETVRGGQLRRTPGGKGANQAVAAARLGATVRMIGAVGDDAAGGSCVTALRGAGVDVERVRTVPTNTGTALIAVDPHGENLIVVSPGANERIEVTAGDLAGCDVVLAQLEVPLAAVEAAAAAAGGLFCLNAAPSRELPSSLIQRCDLVVVNQHERAAIPELDAARRLIVTYGADGAALVEHGREVARARPPRVDVVDTVGAGDAFTAAVAICFAAGVDAAETLAFACAVGALATTRPGAQPALPTRAEVEALRSRM
jgi:ribokinase